MTNREYMESLSDEELAEYLWIDKPWHDYCAENGYEWGDYIELLIRWLNFEH